MPMPDRIVTTLGYTAAALVAVYLVLVVVTVSMASWQTNLAMEVHETEAAIASLESRYYDMVKVIDQTDPSALGLEAPERVMYATSQAAPVFTLR
ncbi:MAG: hypothetical protein V4644_02950 [Patescibacteria group bacterium]